MGMVVGEKRRITLPYTLAYDRKGNKELGIPPFAALVYTVKLLSLT
jgi:FKBP-type peptidyl-prolyl cis-trans isomerase